MREVYKVIIDGKDSGIKETNYKYAYQYWKFRASILDKKIILVEEK
jgi:hypothetical protein